jgi:hypothetical protein
MAGPLSIIPPPPTRRSWTYVRDLPDMAGNKSKIDAAVGAR